MVRVIRAAISRMSSTPCRIAKLTVKEFLHESDGSRIYSVEAVDVVKPAGNWVSKIPEDSQSTPQAGFEEKLQQRIDEVKPSGDASFSLASSRMLENLNSNAITRIQSPARRHEAMSKLPRKLEDLRLWAERLELLAGVKRLKKSIRTEAKRREEIRLNELEAKIHQDFQSVLDFPTRVGMAREAPAAGIFKRLAP